MGEIKKVLSMIMLILTVAGIICGIVFYKHRQEQAAMEEKYQRAISYMEMKDYFYAEELFGEAYGYKNAYELKIYCSVMYDVAWYLEEPESLKEWMDMIPADYSGDYADKIAELRDYIENKYAKDKRAHWKEQEKYCLQDGCNKSRKSGSYYCSEHACAHAGCSYGATDGSRYCNSHKDDEKQSGGKKTGTATGKRTEFSYDDDHLDPDDYDVDGFYQDNRNMFENEDDAWDYMEDEPDDWD